MIFRDYVMEDTDADIKNAAVDKEVDSKDPAVKDALTWMTNKYQDRFKFKHIPNMLVRGENCKSYDISVGENTYKLNLRKFDSNGDGEGDTLAFDVLPVYIEDEEEEEDDF